MTRRPAVTLMEVLIAMFIMAIGMLALLALFPVGAVSMAQALKDDRCAYASLMAENVAIANNIRYGDAYVSNALNSFAVAPAGLVYVDPYGVLGIPALPPPLPPYGVPLGGVIQRVAPSFVYPQPPTPPLPLPPLPGSLPLIKLIDRWFSLPDDITFTLSGTSDTSATGGSIIDVGRRYSFAYLLKQNPPASQAFQIQPLKQVQLFAVVYAGRPVSPAAPEPTYAALGATGTNGIVVSPTPPNPWPPTIKRGGWVLDPVSGYFYRVTNLVDAGASMTVEVQQNLLAPVAFITVMDYVAEVFDKGFGWQQ